MKIIQLLFKVLIRDFKNLLLFDLPLKFRITYPFKKYLSIINNLVLRKKTINYLGENLSYDNWTIPISLQAYPHELIYSVKKNLESPVNTILDVGGNIGQFSITASKFFRNCKIDVFEPNPSPFKLLEKNTKKTEKIKIYNYGIGESSSKNLFYEESKTAVGSLIEENAKASNFNSKNQEIKKVKIQLIDDVAKLTKRNHYDLVKIDVEGYEFEVIKNLKNLNMNYLFIEISGNRASNYNHASMYTEIQKKFGNFDIVYQSKFKKEKVNFEVLLKFLK